MNPKDLGTWMERALLGAFVDELRALCVEAHGEYWVDDFSEIVRELCDGIMIDGFERKIPGSKTTITPAMASRLKGYSLLLGGWVTLERQEIGSPSPSVFLDEGQEVFIAKLH